MVLQAPALTAAVFQALGAKAGVVAGEITGLLQVCIGRIFERSDRRFELGQNRRQRRVLANLGEAHDVGAGLPDGEAKRAAQHLGLTRHVFDKCITILADGIAHEDKLLDAGRALYAQRQDRDEMPGASHGHDGERVGILDEIVIGPVPQPIKGLEHLFTPAGAIEQAVPVGFERVEAGARGDELHPITGRLDQEPHRRRRLCRIGLGGCLEVEQRGRERKRRHQRRSLIGQVRCSSSKLRAKYRRGRTRPREEAIEDALMCVAARALLDEIERRRPAELMQYEKEIRRGPPMLRTHRRQIASRCRRTRSGC